MKKYTGKFNKYQFDNEANKICIKIEDLRLELDAYFEALEVPSLIGALAPDTILEWECDGIYNNRITNPMNIKIRNE